MAVRLITDSPNGKLGEVIDYDVTEDATPLNIDDSDGSVGQLRVAARAITKGPIKDRSVAVIGSEITLSDNTTIEYTAVKGYGAIKGQITDAPVVGERINISAETLRSRFHTDRVAKPYYGSFIPSSSSVSQRVNLNPNPDYETNTTGVTAVNTGTGTFTIARPTDGPFTGTYFASAVYGTANATTHGAGAYISAPVPLAAVSYTFSGYFRISRATTVAEGTPVQRIQVMLRYYNASSVQVGTDVLFRQTVTTNNWIRLSASGEAPATATTARLYIVSTTGTGYAPWKIGDSIDIDATMFEEGGLGIFFSGNTANTSVTSEDGVTVARTTVWDGTANASSSTETLTITEPDRGYDATQGNYFRYLCELVGIANPEIDPEFDRKPVAYPGWEGDVWTQVKKFCAAIDAEVAMVNDTVILRKPRTHKVPLESVSDFVVQTQQTLTSQFVEVINYNSYWGVDELAVAPDTIYQVNVGETQVADLNIPHFIEHPNTPVPVLEFDMNYTVGQGQYQVLDSQNVIVEPEWWLSQGGRVEVVTVYDEPHKLRVIVHGPYSNGPTYVGPYKLARMWDEPLPALSITGSGVFINEEAIRIRTGVSAEQTSTIVGPTIDNEFISNKTLAYTKGLDAACTAAGPVVTINGTMGYDVTANGQSFGTLIGGRLSVADNVFRISSVSYTRGGIAFTAKADMLMSDLTDLFSYTFAEFNDERGTITFTQFNTAEGPTKTFAQFNAAQAAPTFDTFNVVNDGATFNTHAIFPNINEVYVAEQAI